jgi:DNA-binding MarR family transcriptional regulator
MPRRKPVRPKSTRSVSPHKPAPANATKLTKTEQDLLSHLEQGYQLESEAFGNGLLLRNLKDNSVVRTASANQSTIKGLEERGLIERTQGRDKLTTIWRTTTKK